MPIAWLLTLLLAGLVLFTALPVGSLGFWGARENTGRLFRDRAEVELDLVISRLRAHLDPIRDQMTYIATAVRERRIDLDNQAVMDGFILGALSATPQVLGVVVTRTGIGSRRYIREGGHVSAYPDADDLPAVSANIREASSDPQPRWIGPLVSSVLKPGKIILALRVPLVGRGREAAGVDGSGGEVEAIRGTIVAAVSITELSRFLAKISDDTRQTAFILSGRDRVIAHPALSLSMVPNDGNRDDPLPPVHGFKDEALAAIWERPKRQLTSFAPFLRSEGHWSWTRPDSWESRVYVYREVSGYGSVPWIVGIHSPGAETRRERWTVNGIAIGGIVLLAIALAAAFVMSRRLGDPILGLAEAAKRIEELDFTGVKQLPRGPIRELNRATRAFERMAAGLVWFETYLPKTLVRRLVALGDGGVPLAEMRDVTILFTDLEGYTAYSASRPADEVVEYLNQLLARIGPIIEAGGGTIDKYIGDSVMAFWGAPEPDPDHAAAACAAALAIAAEVEAFNAERRAAGLHACRMRLGLHSGHVAVGNVGFVGRVDYTIIGRAVNVAQRLEQSGRDASARGDTVILASSATREAAASRRSFAAEDELHIDGAGPIHRLVG